MKKKKLSFLKLDRVHGQGAPGYLRPVCRFSHAVGVGEEFDGVEKTVMLRHKKRYWTEKCLACRFTDPNNSGKTNTQTLRGDLNESAGHISGCKQV